MALQSDFQALVDEVAKNTSAAASTAAALKAESDELAATRAQDAEHLAAIVAATGTLRETNAALQVASSPSAAPAPLPEPPAAA